jgi:hypothetical protein
MRTHLVFQLVSVGLIAATAAVWIQTRSTAVDLQARIAALTAPGDAVGALEQERDRLHSALAETVRLRREEATPPSLPAAQPQPPTVAAAPLPLGEWRSSKEWRNEGQSTARGAVNTLLWAAAGGDLNTMIQLIAFDEAAREKAQAVFNGLPLSARQAFVTPEAMVANFTIQAVPDNAAQLCWFRQQDADHATAGLLLGGPERAVPADAPMASPIKKNALFPSEHRYNKLTILSLERSARGWRVVIPTTAIDRLAWRARHLSQKPN